jgi:PKD repeat protein
MTFDFRGFNTETGVQYRWDLGDGTTAVTKDVVHKYAKDGHYDVSLTVTTDKGCSNTAEIKKMVYAAPVPTAGFTMQPGLCLNPGKDTVSYKGTALAADTYHWDLKAFDPEEIIQTPDTTAGPFVFELINKPKATISLFVVSSYGCQSPLASLEIKRKPLFSYELSAVEGCAPLLVNFSAKPDDPVDQLDFKWFFGPDETGTGAEIDHTYETPDLVYDLGLTAVSSVTGCTDSIFSEKQIVVHPNPKAGFGMDHDIVYNDMPTVSFQDQSTDAINYYWDFGDGLRSREKDPVHSYDVVGKRKVVQTVYNEFDCQDTTSNFVLVAFNKIFAPNAFAPNAVAAIDRQFLLSSEGIAKEGYHLSIFSRWNDKVFECKNEIKGWDGKMSNGNFAPAGNYIWILECFDFLGRPHRQSGLITLVF